MGWRAWVLCGCVGLLIVGAVIEVRAKQPIFVSWLVADDPGDQTILHFWNRYDQDDLSPAEMVDLGTMLFYRGYPKDAIRVFERALDEDPKLYEAWFRIGLVEHQQGDLRSARIAYKRCLKILKGHGWCNFYLGLLEEQEGNSRKAMERYKAAFRYAPVLADPEVNPELASSDLSLGAWLVTAKANAFKRSLPMPYLNPSDVDEVQSGYAEALEDRIAKEKAANDRRRAAAVADAREEEGADQPPEAEAAKDEKQTPVKRISVKRPKSTSERRNTGKRRATEEERSPGASTEAGVSEENTTPFGLPGNRSTSSEGYPGF